MQKAKNAGIPEIFFTNDWKEIVSGELRRGSQIRIIYDNRRLPRCRATYAGMMTWSINAYVKFKCSDDIVTFHLDRMIQKSNKYDSGQNAIMTADMTIPGDAEKLTMWFVNADRGSCVDFDSRYGQNYHFALNKKVSYPFG